MQWEAEATDWEPWLPLISPLAGRLWPWLLSIPGPGRTRVVPSEARRSPPQGLEGTVGTVRPCLLPAGRAPCAGPDWAKGSGAWPALRASPTHPGSPAPEGLTHGPQVGPSGRRAVRGRLAHQLVDGGQLVDGPVHFVHGRQDRPVGRRLQVAPAQRVTTRVMSIGGLFPVRSPAYSAPAIGGGDPDMRPGVRGRPPPHPASLPRHGHWPALSKTPVSPTREVKEGGATTQASVPVLGPS